MKPKTSGRERGSAKLFRYRLETIAAKAASYIVPLFPRSWVIAAGRFLGSIGYRISARAREVARANVEIAFGDTKSAAEKERIAKGALQNLIATLLGLFWSRRLKKEMMGTLAQYDPAAVARVHELQKQGKGIIFLTLHYGDWEMLGLAAGHLGIHLNVVVETMRNKSLEGLFAELRGATGHRIISQQFAITKLVRALKRGENIALLTDLTASYRSGGVWLNYFGLPVLNNSAVAGMSLRMGAPIVCAVAFPLPGGRVRIQYGPEIEFEPTGNEQADLVALSQKCLDFCESVVRQQPEHWLWTYKRWKWRPTEEQGRYPFYSRYLVPRKQTRAQGRRSISRVAKN